MNRPDAIVIGSGIGGLTAATVLANAGLHPLVLEHHFAPGGLPWPWCQIQRGMTGEGQQVQRGQLLAMLNSTGLSDAQLNLLKAKPIDSGTWLLYVDAGSL